MKKKEDVGTSISKLVSRAKVAKIEVSKLSQAEKDAIEEEKKNQPKSVLDELLKDVNKEKEEQERQKLAEGFVRSKQSLAMRVKQEIDHEMVELEDSKFALIQKLNDALLRLDKVNTYKREMSGKLVE